MKADLRVDWATHEAAKYACEHWHYTKSMPMPPYVFVGCWEDKVFVGVAVFSRGANKDLGAPYGLGMTECCELVRVAMRKHKQPVSQFLALAVRFLKKNSPNLRMVVSFADPEQGHHGGIYQACGWVYSGQTVKSFDYRMPDGSRLNKRAFTGNQFGQSSSRSAVPIGAIKTQTLGKHRYLMPLDDAMRSTILPLSKPYPKRVRSSETSGDHPEERQGSTDPDAPNA
jgi:hypothetical protein